MPPPPPLHCDTVYLLYYYPLPSHALPAHIHKYLCIFSQAPASRHIKFNTLRNCHSQCNCQFNWLWGNCGTTWFETKQRAKLFATSRKLQLKRNQKTEATKRNQISIKIKQITTNAFGYSITRYSYCEINLILNTASHVHRPRKLITWFCILIYTRRIKHTTFCNKLTIISTSSQSNRPMKTSVIQLT